MYSTEDVSQQLKQDLHRYLREARAALLWKLDGLSEYQVRRPMTAHGTNLLGLVKHLAGCEIGYFGYVFGRPFPHPPRWLLDPTEPTVDMWAAPHESRRDIVELYQRACSHADNTIESLRLEHPGHVPTWPAERQSVTLHEILTHMLAETSRHAGHADVVREMIDDAAGLHPGRSGLPDLDADYWPALHRRIEHAAQQAGEPAPELSLRPMTDSEYDTATEIREAQSIQALTQQMPLHEAEQRVRRATFELLPQRQRTPGHHLVVGVDRTDMVVGYAWIGPDVRRAVSIGQAAWLYDIYVYPSVRRQRYGLALLTAVERLAFGHGAAQLVLNVNADNVAARNLYQHAGYTITSQYLHKALAAP